MHGAGLHTAVIPMIDRGVRLNLNRNIPDWRSLSKEEIQEKALDLCLADRVVK